MATHDVPGDLSYTAEHEWVRLDGEVATVGITAYAADALGEVVFVQLPELGRTYEIGDVAGEVESHKSVSEIFAPVEGEVIAVNAELAGAPELVSADPYQEGWLFRMQLADHNEDLLDGDEYAKVLEELD